MINDIKDIPVYMICLERNNKCNITLPILKSNFNNVNYFKAIDGEKININNFKYSKKVHSITKFNIKNKLKLNHKNIHNKGQLGCYFSHIKLWKKCVKLNKSIIVIEDDIKIKNFTEVNKILNYIKNNDKYDYVSIIFLRLLSQKNNTNKFFEPLTKNHYGTQFYYIKPSGAKKLLKYLFPIIYQIDSYINIISCNEGLNSVYYRDNLIDYSMIGKSNINYNFKINLWLPSSNIFYIVIIIIILYLLYNYKKCPKIIK